MKKLLLLSVFTLALIVSCTNYGAGELEEFEKTNFGAGGGSSDITEYTLDDEIKALSTSQESPTDKDDDNEDDK